MNEILLAIEAMITRIVREEMRANPPATPLTSGPAFDQMVRSAVLDKPWFDEAIRNEATMQVDALPTRGYQLRDVQHFRDLVTEAVNTHSPLQHQITAITGSCHEDFIRDTVVNDSTIHDHIVELIAEADDSGSRFRQRVEEIIDDHFDVEDAVADALRNVSFSTTID